MKILLTGVTGYLGSNLAKSLLEKGYEIVALKRSFSDVNRIKDFIQSICIYDIDKCRLQQPFIENKIDVIIHTATCYGRKNENAVTIFETNTLFPLELLENAISFHVPSFINTDTALDKYVNNYSLSKKQFTEWGKKFTDEKRISFININLEHFYGPFDDSSKFLTYIIKSCYTNVPELSLTFGEQKRDFIYISDVISAYLLLLKTIGQEVYSFQEYNVGSSQPIKIKDLVELVHKLTNSKTELKFGAIPYRKNEIMESVANIDALAKLGWTCDIDLKKGIQLIIDKEINK
jgi:nucleoside-diphosphate-sugar epimerase